MEEEEKKAEVQAASTGAEAEEAKRPCWASRVLVLAALVVAAASILCTALL